MRDKREPTQPNAPHGGTDEGLADRLPKTLGSRLRAARIASGLAQGGVAKAMSQRGFSWRQTTVAKSEAADRPVLFAEVAALAHIYRRPIEYFMYPGTELDSLLDEALSEMESIRQAVAEAYAHVNALKSDQRLYECRVGLASSVVRYRTTSDSGFLLDDLQKLLQRYGLSVLQAVDIYDSLGLKEVQISEIDQTALQEIARAELARTQWLSESDLPYESAELLTGLADFLEGKEVSDALVSSLRSGMEWQSLVVVPLADLLIAAVHRQQEEE